MSVSLAELRHNPRHNQLIRPILQPEYRAGADRSHRLPLSGDWTTTARACTACTLSPHGCPLWSCATDALVTLSPTSAAKPGVAAMYLRQKTAAPTTRVRAVSSRPPGATGPSLPLIATVAGPMSLCASSPYSDGIADISRHLNDSLWDFNTRKDPNPAPPASVRRQLEPINSDVRVLVQHVGCLGIDCDVDDSPCYRACARV